MDYTSTVIDNNGVITVTLTPVSTPIPVPTPVPDPTPTPVPPVPGNPPITNPIPLALGPFGTNPNDSPFQPGEKRYYQIIVPPGMKTLTAAVVGYDQKPILNMLLEKGDPVDYFDDIYKKVMASEPVPNWPGGGSTGYLVINNTQTWERMTNDPYMQNLYFFGPPAGTYYLVVKNMDPVLTSRINVTVNAY